MATVPRSGPRAPIRYRFSDLPSFTQNETLLWNWLCRAGPGADEWQSWLADIFGHLLETPGGYELRLVQTHLVDAAAGEKTLEFGSKMEVLFGRHAQNDVVLAASAISSKHARLSRSDGRLYLEDLGGPLGTYLWDTRIPPQQKQQVRNGDQFTVFPYRFRVLLERSWGAVKDVSVADWTLHPTSRAEFLNRTPPDFTSFVLDADPGKDAVLVGVSSTFLQGLGARILTPLRLPTVTAPVPSDDVFISFILFAILERLNRKLKFPLQFCFARDGRKTIADATRGMMVNFALRVDDLCGRFRVFLTLGLVSEPARWPLEKVNAKCFRNIGWRFPVIAGSVDLSPDEFSQIGLGDIVVAQPAPALLFPTDSTRGWSLLAAEARNFAGLRIDNYFEKGPTVSDGKQATVSTSQLGIEGLPVRLHVVLAEKQFTLAEIQSLGPGTIVELDATKFSPVRLMANGITVGEGELVEVEGNLAVRVLGWRNG